MPDGQQYIPPKPDGLLGDIAEYIYEQSPYPNHTIALNASIALMAAICGRAYNTYTGAELNLYILLLASTGMGKEAASTGITKLLKAISTKVPAAMEFMGPAIVSSAGLLKWLDRFPSILCIIGEFGYKLKAMCSPRAGPNEQLLRAVLLDLFSKSGAGGVITPMAYSDKERNTNVIYSPAFSLLAESTPGIVYEAFNEKTVSDGLLPRFMVSEVTGKRPILNENAGTIAASEDLVQQLADLSAHALSLAQQGKVQPVLISDQAKEKFRELERFATLEINSHINEVYR
ncbi:MAG: hypothetical protein AB7G25_05075 [Sphingomonadaceae bacterium]